MASSMEGYGLQRPRLAWLPARNSHQGRTRGLVLHGRKLLPPTAEDRILALESRIGARPGRLLMPDSSKPGGDPLDPVFAEIPNSTESRDAGFRAESISGRGDDSRGGALPHLAGPAILEVHEQGFLWRPAGMHPFRYRRGSLHGVAPGPPAVGNGKGHGRARRGFETRSNRLCPDPPHGQQDAQAISEQAIE